MNRTPVGAARKTAVVAVLGLLVALGAFVPSASATSSYSYGGSFSTGTDPVYPLGPCTVYDLAVDAQENVYTLCGGQASINGSGGTVIKKFDKNGNPVPFTGSASYISGNTITENPDPNGNGGGQYGNTFEGRDTIAVDRSPGGTAGYIYVTHTPSVEIFNPEGKWVGSIVTQGAFGVQADTVDSSGNLYINSQFKINKYDPSWTLHQQLFASASNNEFTVSPGAQALSVDSTGAIWGIGTALESFPTESVAKYEASGFGPPEVESTFAFGSHRKAQLSPYVSAPLTGFGSATALKADSLAVDQQDNSLYVLRVSPVGILHFSGGSPSELAHQLGGVIGTTGQVTGGSGLSANDGLALGWASKALYAANGASFSKFTPGPPLPTVHTEPPQTGDIGHTTATVRGAIDLAGGTPITGCEVKYGLTSAYESSAPCSPNPASSPPGSNFTVNTPVTASLSGLNLGSTYHYAFIATNAAGEGLGSDRTFRTAAVLRLQTKPATEITDNSATLNGALDPDGMATTYHFEYGLAGEYTQETAPVAPVTGTGEQQLSIPVSGLKADGAYHYRIVATNSLGTTQGPDQTFTVAGPPTVSGVRATNVREAEADLNAKINPGGYPTTYKFEYGTAQEYGSTIPAPTEGDAGEGSTGGSHSEHLEGLQVGVTYHFRVVATNKWGTTASGDTTFNFSPQSCPNEHVRQQDKSSFLPDCRAYELVSPPDAGGVQIYPGNEVYTVNAETGPGSVVTKQQIQNTGLAQTPSRFMYYGGLGSVTGMDTPNIALDSYVATRTNEGWVTTFPGLKGSEGGQSGRKVCLASFEFCLDHKYNTSEYEVPQNVGYLFDSSGEKVGVLPSNVKSIPNGEKFSGDWQPSPTFNHFVFSSSNVPFAPGGLTQAPGSAYDENRGDHSISVISKLPNGSPIGSDSANAQEFITFPPGGISQDGSHVLMRTEASDGPNHLYMRVNDAVTYDIANGAGVRLVGMTADGTSVVFLATQRLVSEDTDESADLYRWDENGGSPTLTLLSKGNGQGNSDSCHASWTAKCSVALLATERGNRTGLTPVTYKEVTLPGPDNSFGRGNGSVYFFSPENLAGNAPLNGKNLYLAREGQVQYVTTFGAQQTIERVQLSPDGTHGGFLTKAQLTSYGNEGFSEMYAYDARTGEINCASCIPSGEPPTVNVEASQNGPFMADDGRVFFSTADPLVPQDVDPLHLPDVYEYVEGRPQLISSGVSTNAKAPGGAAYFVAATLGLESVSANGADVFFSTTDSLVPQDHNGRFVKIYDARTNGGFEPPVEPAPCVAADECHGPGSSTPEPAQIGTGSSVNGGNVATTAKRANRSCLKSKRRKGSHKRSKACAGRKRHTR
jgi:hypothetical protein